MNVELSLPPAVCKRYNLTPVHAPIVDIDGKSGVCQSFRLSAAFEQFAFNRGLDAITGVRRARGGVFEISRFWSIVAQAIQQRGLTHIYIVQIREGPASLQQMHFVIVRGFIYNALWEHKREFDFPRERQTHRIVSI